MKSAQQQSMWVSVCRERGMSYPLHVEREGVARIGREGLVDPFFSFNDAAAASTRRGDV